jgi:hypothetical protein
MKTHFILITAILAMSAGFGVSSNAIADSPDAQASAKLGDHPAVVVARTKRSIDPNTFIVAHPAGLQLLAASPNSKGVPAQAEVASTLAP